MLRKTVVCASLVAAFVSVPTRGQLVMLQPTAVSTAMGSSFGAPGNTVDQSGLSTAYASLSTDFATYTGANPTHNSNIASNQWASVIPNATGNVDFDLGGTYTLQRFVLWNLNPGAQVAVKDFQLLASADNTFTTTTSLGSFSAGVRGVIAASDAQVFTLTSASAAYVRMVILSNQASTNFTGFGEVAFGVVSPAAVPEPSPLALGGLLGAMGLAWRLRAARLA